jgi:hypothetical protein
MTLRIKKTWTPSAGEWDKAWGNCPYSTYFHSREWAEIWAEYTCGKTIQNPKGILLSDGTQIILPFSKEIIFKKLTRRYISSPAGTFGGWLAPKTLDHCQQALLMKFIARRYSNLLWRFNPYEQIFYTGKTDCITQDETLTLDLSGGFEQIYHEWTKGHASAARKARKACRAGVEIRIAETPSDWENYFTIYADSLNRWGENSTMAYPWHLFETIMRRESPNIRLWLASYQGTLVAGALCFYSPTHVVYWHGAALSSYFNLRPVNLLMYEAIHDATERGLKWFDFNPSGGLDGVRAFKRSFGAIPLSCNVVVTTSFIMQGLSLVAKLIRHMRRVQ